LVPKPSTPQFGSPAHWHPVQSQPKKNSRYWHDKLSPPKSYPCHSSHVILVDPILHKSMSLKVAARHSLCPPTQSQPEQSQPYSFSMTKHEKSPPPRNSSHASQLKPWQVSSQGVAASVVTTWQLQPLQSQLSTLFSRSSHVMGDSNASMENSMRSSQLMLPIHPAEHGASGVVVVVVVESYEHAQLLHEQPYTVSSSEHE